MASPLAWDTIGAGMPLRGRRLSKKEDERMFLGFPWDTAWALWLGPLAIAAYLVVYALRKED